MIVKTWPINRLQLYYLATWRGGRDTCGGRAARRPCTRAWAASRGRASRTPASRGWTSSRHTTAQFASTVFQDLGLMYFRYFDLQCRVPSASPGVWRCRACRSGRRGDSSPCPPPAPAPGPCRPPPGSGAEQPPVLVSISDDVIYGRTPLISQELTHGCDGKHEAARGEHGDHDQWPVSPPASGQTGTDGAITGVSSPQQWPPSIPR